MYSPEKSTNNIPQTPGIYQFIDKNKTILYIGKAINLRNRVKSYFQKNTLSPKTKQLVSKIKSINIIQTESEFEALLLEAKLINKIQPKYNIISRDDKHPLYIKITKENYPKIKTVRREDDNKSKYFGPFPSSTIVKDTLRFLREIFPYCSDSKIGKRPCFYSHIGLCNPCPNYIESLTANEQEALIKTYRYNLMMIRKLLDGSAKSVMSSLEKDMKDCANKKKYEKAAKIKIQLEKLEYLRTPRTPIKEYLQNPNLYDDIRQEELKNLSRILKLKHVEHIEGYDISNTQGTLATGSMVTFINAEPEKSLYRKFRIKRKQSPDDTFMMHEVLVRRLKHKDWTYPDLIIVDGGKGQISAALHAMEKLNVTIPTIGLAKRLEEIIIPTNNEYITVRLKKDSRALHLLQRIRDEAHRFANTYHKRLRSKTMV